MCAYGGEELGVCSFLTINLYIFVLAAVQSNSF